MSQEQDSRTAGGRTRWTGVARDKALTSSCAAFVLRDGARVIWSNRMCLDAALMISYHTIVVVLAVRVSGGTRIQAHAGHLLMLLRIEMQHIKDMRIEQLGNEEERLDFERAFALKRAMGSPSSHPKPGKDAEEGEPEAG